MKALVLHGIGELRFEAAWPDPAVPEGWACVRVGASGICGSDLPRLMQHGAYKHPLIPGHEFAGTVVEPGCIALPKGRKVAILPQIPCGQCAGCRVGPFHCTNYDFIGSRRDGGFAEYCAVPASNLFALPDGLPLEAGAFIEPLAVTLHVVRRANLEAGSRVLVLGGGAIGILTAQWARMLGGREVVLADIRDESLAIATECGIEKVFNPLSEAFKTQDAFTHIFEAAGATAALVTAINKAVPRAVLTVVGRETKDITIPLNVFERLMRKEMDLRGCWGYDLTHDRDFLFQALREERFKLAPLITQRVELAAGPKIITDMWQRNFFFCKVLFDIANSN